MINKKGGSQIENLTFNHKSFKKKGQMKSNRDMISTIGKIFPRAIGYHPCIIKTDLYWERYECPKFWDNKNPSFESLKEIGGVLATF
jgi:hypothetical protein